MLDMNQHTSNLSINSFAAALSPVKYFGSAILPKCSSGREDNGTADGSLCTLRMHLRKPAPAQQKN